jgi:hypothetical protein
VSLSGAADQPGGHDRPDARGVHRHAARCLHQALHPGSIVRELFFQFPDLGNQVPGDVLADGLDIASGADGSQQLGGQVRGQLGRGASGQQIAQQRVELVDRAHPGLRQVHTPFVQESQRRGVILGREVPPVSL